MTDAPVRPLSADDHLAVQRLVHRYTDAVVQRDGRRWTACWAEDAVWDLGRGRRVEGRDAIAELWYSSMARMHAVFQIVHSGEVTADPTDVQRATGRWYISEKYRRASGESGILLAQYDDRYVRLPGDDGSGLLGWRFAARSLVIHYQGLPDVSGTFSNTTEELAARGLAADV